MEPGAADKRDTSLAAAEDTAEEPARLWLWETPGSGERQDGDTAVKRLPLVVRSVRYNRCFAMVDPASASSSYVYSDYAPQIPATLKKGWSVPVKRLRLFPPELTSPQNSLPFFILQGRMSIYFIKMRKAREKLHRFYFSSPSARSGRQ
jgi:hypothetical protein